MHHLINRICHFSKDPKEWYGMPPSTIAFRGIIIRYFPAENAEFAPVLYETEENIGYHVSNCNARCPNEQM